MQGHWHGVFDVKTCVNMVRLVGQSWTENTLDQNLTRLDEGDFTIQLLFAWFHTSGKINNAWLVSPPTVRAAGGRTRWRMWDVVNTPLTLFSSRPSPNSTGLQRGRTARWRPRWTRSSRGNPKTDGDSDRHATRTQKYQHTLEQQPFVSCLVTARMIHVQMPVLLL